MPTLAQLTDLCRFVRFALSRHRNKAAAVALGVALVALAGTLLMPRSYYSEARLFVRFGRENLVDPTAAGGQMVSLYESRESEINSLIEIMRSRAIFERVVAELGPDYILTGRQPRPGSVLAKAQPQSPAVQRAVARLEREVSISAPRKSNILTVACRASSPQLAQRIVAKLVEVYLEEHVRVHRAGGSYEFFAEQTKQSLAAWQTAADALRDAKNRLGIVTIGGQRQRLESQLADLDARRLATEAERKTTEGKIESLKTLVAALPEKIITQAVAGPSAAFDGMRQTLYQLEAQEQDLAAKMQDDHPRLVALRQQVQEARQILAGSPDKQQQATEALNPARQTLETALLAEAAQLEALRSRERSLVAQRDQLRRELEQLNTQAIAIDQLEQRVALAEANHKEYAQRLEQARINRSLDEERISSLSLVQPASFVGTPTGPRRSHVLALGLVLAGLAGLGTALGAAWMNPLLTSAEQLRLVLDLPLAGVLPPAALAA